MSGHRLFQHRLMVSLEKHAEMIQKTMGIIMDHLDQNEVL
jgi:hypothetical protein